MVTAVGSDRHWSLEGGFADFAAACHQLFKKIFSCFFRPELPMPELKIVEYQGVKMERIKNEFGYLLIPVNPEKFPELLTEREKDEPVRTTDLTQEYGQYVATLPAPAMLPLAPIPIPVKEEPIEPIAPAPEIVETPKPAPPNLFSAHKGKILVGAAIAALALLNHKAIVNNIRTVANLRADSGITLPYKTSVFNFGSSLIKGMFGKSFL